MSSSISLAMCWPQSVFIICHYVGTSLISLSLSFFFTEGKLNHNEINYFMHSCLTVNYKIFKTNCLDALLFNRKRFYWETTHRHDLSTYSKYKNYWFIIGTDLFGQHKNLTIQNPHPKIKLIVHCITNTVPPPTPNLRKEYSSWSIHLPVFFNLWSGLTKNIYLCWMSCCGIFVHDVEYYSNCVI